MHVQSQNPHLKIARCVHRPVWILIRVRLERLTRPSLLLYHAVPSGIVIVLRQLLPLLLAPEPPRYERNASDDNRSADPANNTPNDLFARRGKVAAIAAAVCERG